jgi:UDPglucose--hexose-1-phosphate uridylyltransferase
VAEELSAADRYFAEHSRCIFCDLAERELREGTRIVAATDLWVAFCPYAARFPFETWLMPKQHQTHFERISDAELVALAGTLRKCIENIERASNASQYNYLIHSSPFDTGPQSHYHWHIEIFPRMTTTAGFEWATGAFINPVPPEEAAKLLCQH